MDGPDYGPDMSIDAPEGFGIDPLPRNWMHPTWAAILGAHDQTAQEAVERLLCDPRLRGVALSLSTQQGADLRLAHHGPDDLSIPARRAIASLVEDFERLILTLGHIVLRDRIRGLLAGLSQTSGTSFERDLARFALSDEVAGTSAFDALPTPGTDDPWVEGWKIFAGWLLGLKGADRVFLRLVLPASTGRALRGLRADASSGLAVEALLALYEDSEERHTEAVT